MKLRNRKKWTLHNIKQEDQKLDLTLEDASSSSIDHGPTISEANIKQEDTKEHKKMLKQRAEFGKESYYYRCDYCSRKMKSLRSVLDHRKSAHNIKCWNNSKIKDIDKEPDIHDPHFHCKPCERGYRNKESYECHLRGVHFMVLGPSKAPKHNVVPDPDDPNSYCKACDRTYKCKRYYKNHCRLVHGVAIARNADQRSIPGGMEIVSTYCKLCNRQLASKHSYQKHLFIVHRVDERPRRQKPKAILPDIDDPNFYCRSCEKTSVDKHSFKRHLMIVHSIIQSAPRNTSNIKPDTQDPNNYCRACQKTYTSTSNYRIHLRLIHRMTLPSLTTRVDFGKLPDPYDPQHYCRVCKKAYVSSRVYRAHCKLVHLMTLTHASIVRSNATIDRNDPDFYCAQCEHRFKYKQNFKVHLKRVHHLY